MKLGFSNTSIGMFRFIAILEGVSTLLLFFIAMPLKYFANMPWAVKYAGWVHGILFMLYIALLIQVFLKYKWSLAQVLMAFLASLVPFGPFLLNSQHQKEEVIILEQNQPKI